MDAGDTFSRAERAKRGSPFLNTDQAAAYLKVSNRLLRALRVEGGGPVFRLHGKLYQYHIDDLDAWSDGRRGLRVAK
ncbi:MAG: DNA-binding protein [Sphingomonadales bacterium]|nr:MAG: DNA-binding protein [Sphingomonadales bacterium]